ncbi:MAG: hypothetical protein ACI8S6_000705 [Myxococcota bacterium]|jgi:hypothetical protein
MDFSTEAHVTAPVFRYLGRTYQLQIASASDLERIETLDKARWAATSAPLGDFLCDRDFLTYLDSDNDGRIRLLEVRQARRWLWSRLRDRSRLTEQTETLRLDDVDTEHPDAERLLALARHLLAQLSAKETDRITLAQVRHFRQAYIKRFPNGDGIVTPEQVTEPGLRTAVESIVAALGGAMDLSGAAGVRTEDVDTYVAQAQAFIDWRRARAEDATILPLGDDTAAAATLVDLLAPKLDQFFAQCALLALEAGAKERLTASAEDLAALDVYDPAAIEAWLVRAPLATPRADAVLDLGGPLNTHYAASIERFAEDAGPRLLGQEGPLHTLTPSSWRRIRDRLAPHRAWSAAGPQHIPEGADPDTLRAFIDSEQPQQIRALAVQDKEVADELVQFNTLEKVLLYQRWLLEFANNFVSFPALFDENLALFQKGTLVMDGRKMQLAVRVDDRAAHKKLALGSLMFLIYLDLSRTEAGAVRQDSVAIAVTSGTRGGIEVGKRGVFYDREGREWDAIATDVVVQPISLWEAAIAPFIRLRDIVTARLETTVTSRSAELEAEAIEKSKALLPGTAAPAVDSSQSGGSKGNFQNLLVGGSLAVAALASSAAFIVDTVSSIDPLKAALSVGVLVAMIMAVFGFLGWLKLRKRDLSALLEAGGWALNGRMRLSEYMANVFTERPGLPRGAQRRFDEPRSWTQRLILLVVLLILVLAGVYAWNPERFSELVSAAERVRAPAEAPPAAAE